MKKRSLLILVSLVLCFSTLFVSCDFTGGKNKAEQTTAAPVVNNSNDDFDSDVSGASQINTEADIRTLVEFFNSAESAEVDMNLLYNIDKTIYSYISGMKIDISNLKADNEVLFDKVTIDGENIYMESPELDGEVNFKIDETLLVLGLLSSGGELESTVMMDQLQELKEIYSPENFPVEEMPELKMPKVSASDFSHEGGGVYSIKQEYMTKYFKDSLDAFVTSAEISGADMDILSSYFDNIKCEFKYTVSSSKVVSCEGEISFSSEDIAEFAEQYLAVPKLDEEYSFKYGVAYDINGALPTLTELYCDIYLPYTSFADSNLLSVVFMDAELDIDINTKIISNSAQIFDGKFDLDLFAKAYDKKGSSYVYNKDYDDDLADAKASIDVTASLTRGKLAFDMELNSSGEKINHSLSADIDFEKVVIPKLSRSALNCIDKFNNVSKNKGKIDSHLDAVADAVSGQLTEDMVGEQIEYHYDEYDLAVTFNVVYDYDGETVALEIDTYSFYSVDGMDADYIIERKGNSFDIVGNSSEII